MKTLCERLNFSSKEIRNSIKIDTRKNINYFETLCLYCAENNIDLKSIDDNDFMNASDLIQNHSDSAKQHEIYYFSIDK